MGHPPSTQPASCPAEDFPLFEIGFLVWLAALPLPAAAPGTGSLRAGTLSGLLDSSQDLDEGLAHSSAWPIFVKRMNKES